jgi:hypothetical protein
MRRIYAWLLRAYPPGFRAEFEHEMVDVFVEAAADAARHGTLALAGRCLRELRGWMLGVPAAHRSALRAARHGLLQTGFLGRGWRSDMQEAEGNKVDARLAALPLLLLGLGIGLGSLLQGGRWNAIPAWQLGLSIALRILPALAVMVGALIAAARRLPRWGDTWLGSGLMALMVLINVIAEELSEDGRHLISPDAETAIGLLLAATLLIALGVSAVRGRQRASLLGIGLASTFGLAMAGAAMNAPFYRYDLAAAAAPVGIALAGLTYAFVRNSSPGRGAAVLVAVATLNLALLWAANQAWSSWLPDRGQPSPLVPMALVMTGLLAAGPVMSAISRPLLRRV